MDNKFKPMLASRAPKTIKFPVLASPKLNGVRVCIVNGEAVTRTLKPVPNHYIREYLSRQEFDGLDGEVIVGYPTAPDVFSRSTSAVMSIYGEPDFRFMVFDIFREPANSFALRYVQLFSLLNGSFRRCDMQGNTYPPLENGIGFFSRTKDSNLLIVRQEHVESVGQLDEVKRLCVSAGFEGIFVRYHNGQYKFGRSTTKEVIHLKIKRFADWPTSVSNE